MKKAQILFVITALTGSLAVALGAFGAHGLKPYLNEYQSSIYEKAVFYQFVHVLASLAVLFASQVFQNKKFLTASLLFLIGILLFSGSLYGLAIYSIFPLPKAVLGPITPIGGTFFIVGWVYFAFLLSGVSFSDK